jgi:RNA polymerase sigma factor (sigma-70 family)
MRKANPDVRAEQNRQPQDDTGGTSGRGVAASRAQPGSREWVGVLLGDWQASELRIARGFAECRGLAVEQLEDIYQETALALLSRPYASEEHLRNALRHGIKHRALNMHRDTRRRSQILAQSAPSMQRVAEARDSKAGPEDAALSQQDRLIVREFLTELDELEQRVFWLIADGMRYRAIASALDIPVNQARNTSRSCERKRERFQLLYDTGRLCGYRAATIESLQRGELTEQELTRRAFAHLDACAQCRTEHRTKAKRPGRSFGGQLTTLLLLRALLGRAEALSHHGLRARLPGVGGIRDRVAALVGAGGGAAKLAASVATVSVVAGGTIGATRALDHSTPQNHHQATKGSLRVPIDTAAQGLSRAQSDIGVHEGSTRARRAQRSGHGPTRLARAETRIRVGASGAVERDFTPERSPSPPAGPDSALTQPVVSGQENAQREFGIG